MDVKGLLKRPGNEKCADCGLSDPTWGSCNLGVFLCDGCADIHKSLGQRVSKVKPLLDSWSETEYTVMETVGNLKSKLTYESQVPVCYRRPKANDPWILRDQWIRGKYERRDFADNMETRYESGRKEGYLWKRGREDKRFQRRLFMLDEDENTLRYYNSDNLREPKSTYRLDEVNVALIPYKFSNPNSMQITHAQDGVTRSLYVYAETGQEMVEWYNCIRSVKLKRLMTSQPTARVDDLCQRLTRDYIKEGWLSKSGPRSWERYKRRWVTLDQKRLLYYEDPLDAYPKGEVVIGTKEQGYAVRNGVPPGITDPGYTFTLKTPERRYYLCAETASDKHEWMEALRSVCTC